jgi:hypothetical protein
MSSWRRRLPFVNESLPRSTVMSIRSGRTGGTHLSPTNQNADGGKSRRVLRKLDELATDVDDASIDDASITVEELQHEPDGDSRGGHR